MLQQETLFSNFIISIISRVFVILIQLYFALFAVICSACSKPPGAGVFVWVLFPDRRRALYFWHVAIIGHEFLRFLLWPDVGHLPLTPATFFVPPPLVVFHPVPDLRQKGERTGQRFAFWQ